jgi:hypothetical protein
VEVHDLVLATCLEGKINIKPININCLLTGVGAESDTSKTPHMNYEGD